MITTAPTNSFREELFNGIHRPEHVYKLALYTSAADLDEHTRGYETKGEVADDGYPKGGIVLTGRKVGVAEGHSYLQFSDARFPKSSISSDGSMIYNDSVDGKPALAVYGYPRTAGVNSEYVVELPPQLIQMV